MTASGSYLAARHAGQERDAASAAAYYRLALKHDPKNNDLLDRTFLSMVVGGDIDQIGALRRAHRAGRQERPRRPAGARRQRAQAQAIPDCAPQSGAVDPRADHRSDRDAVVGLVAGGRRRSEGGGGGDRPAERAGLVRDLQGIACRHDLRPRRQQEGSGQTLRARLQARSDRAARGAGLWQLAVAQRLHQGGARRVRDFRQGAAASPAGGRRHEQAQGRRETAAADRQRAGRRRRGALWARRLARPPRRRGPRPGLPATVARARAQPSAGAARARRSL